MKTQLSAVLFAFVLGCGGEKKSTVEKYDPKPVSVKDTVAVPVDELPKPEPKKDVVEVVMPKTFDDAMTMGKELVTKGEHPRAREILELAAKLEKKKSDPHVELARSY